MHSLVSARDRRTLAAGSTAIILLITLSRGVPWTLVWQRDRVEAAASALRDVADGRRTATKLPALRDSLATGSTRLAAMDSLLIGGASAAAAAASLAAQLEDLAGASGLEVTAVQLRSDSASPGAIAPVAVRVTGTTDVTGLANFLRTVESGVTPLAVRELGVSQPDPSAPPSRIESLHVDVLVEGLARVQAVRSGPGPKTRE